MAANPAVVSAGVREVWLIRHGETPWSLSGQHTGRTDIALTEHGREQARSLAATLTAQRFDTVLCSPMARAIETCQLTGLGGQMAITVDLHEWDYGIYEGRTTADIHKTDPGWSVWRSPISRPAPGSENITAPQMSGAGSRTSVTLAPIVERATFARNLSPNICRQRITRPVSPSSVY